MKKIFTLCVLLTFMCMCGRGQTTSTATWALTTSPGNATTTGNVTGVKVGIGGGLTGTAYTTAGIATYQWNDGISPYSNTWYQYAVTPTTGYTYNVSSISLTPNVSTSYCYYSLYSYILPVGTAPTNADFYNYSGDVGNSYYQVNAGNTTANTISGLNLSVPSGYTLYIRVYASYVYDYYSTYFYNKNVTITGLTYANSYCTPTYSAQDNTVDYISNVSLSGASGNLSNASSISSPSIFYSDYTTKQPGSLQIPNLIPGKTYTVAVTMDNDADQYSGVWIDFNKDNTFSTTEFFSTNANAGANGTANITITVPATATAGTTRMRVRGGDDYQPTSAQGCGAAASSYGETEDYLVNIVSPPVITYTALSGQCSGSAITLSNINIVSSVGVSTTANLPRIYYKLSSASTYTSQPLTLTSGTATNSLWSYTFPANTFAGGTTVQYFVVAQDVSNTPIIGSSPSGALSSTNSVSNITTFPSSVNSFAVTATPIVAAVGGNATVCAGATTTYTDATTGGTWSVTNGTGTATITSAGILTGGTAGTVTVVYTVTSGGCSSTATKSVTVNALPTVAVIGGNSSVCVNATATYTDATTGGTWSVTNGTGSATITSAGVLTGSTAGTVTVIYTYNNGSCSNSATKSVTVNALPTPTITVSASPYCAGSNVGYATESGQSNYVWTYSGTLGTDYTISGGGNTYQVAVKWLTSGSKTVTVNYANSNNCTGAAATSNTITINALPTANISGTQTICNGSSANLTFAFTGVSPWSVSYTDGTNTYSASSTTNTATKPVSPNTTTTYTLGASSVTDGSGCSSGSTTGSAIITVNQKPTASITPVSGSACEGTAVQVNITGTAGASISYKLNGTTQASQTLPYAFNSPSNAGTYTYDLQSVTANSCTGTISNPTSTVTINSYPTVAAIGGSNYVQTATTTQLTNTTAGGVWASSASTVASLGSTSGTPITVTGVAEGLSNVTYTVTSNSCPTTVNKSVRVYNPDYITQASGNFSNAGTWQIDRDDNTFVTSVPVPAGTNYTSIRVQHALTLNQDFQLNTGRSFSLITGGTMDIASGKTFSSLGSVDFGSKLVTVKSDASGTGAIGQMAANIANADNVQVERFIGSSTFATGRRAWRLLASPVTGITINNAWQEGAVSTNNPPTYTNTTYGTLITGYTQGTAANAFDHGYDFWTAIANSNSSIRYYAGNSTSGAWNSLPGNGLKNLNIEAYPAYMLYIRGNRSTLNTGFSITTLRAKGLLKQGTVSTNVPGGNAFTVAGNPFASPVDFEQIYGASIGIKPQFTTWNSQNGTYGAYTLVQRNGINNYTIIPNAFNGGTGSSSGVAQYIVSGQGFFVEPSSGSGGTLVIGEAAKTSSASSGINPYRIVSGTDKKIYVNLNLKGDTSVTLADGLLVRFDASYTNDIDEDDAIKQANFNENLGISSSAINLIVEARPDAKNSDTVKLKLWNVVQRSYQLQVMAENFATAAAAGLHAYVEDNYTGTKQEADLSGSITTINFSVNGDANSSSADRFRIVFQNDAVLPVTISKVSAQPKNGGAEVNWTVANEVNIKGYTVEKSTDGGRTFAAVGTQQAARNNPQAALTSYNSYDATPKAGDNYYRIKIEAKDGNIMHSDIVKVTIGANGTGIQITLYPNPVREGKANLMLTNLTEGTYIVSVYTGSGQTVYQKKITITQGNATQSEQLLPGKNLAQGSYQIRLADYKGNIIFTDKLFVGR